MILTIDLPLILAAAFVASASPGPATLAIADTSMAAGRRAGLALALGVSAGSVTWSVAAAFGLSAVMASSAWTFEVLRYVGAGYLLFLSLKAARSAIRGTAPRPQIVTEQAPARAFAKGLAIHLTNPKAVLFFGSLYSLGISAETSSAELLVAIAALGVQSTLVFTLYAWLFSSGRVSRFYLRTRRWFEGAFAVVFAGAGLKVLTTRFST